MKQQRRKKKMCFKGIQIVDFIILFALKMVGVLAIPILFYEIFIKQNYGIATPIIIGVLNSVGLSCFYRSIRLSSIRKSMGSSIEEEIRRLEIQEGRQTQ